MNKITSIIRGDIPEWAKEAFDSGQLFNRLSELIDKARIEAIGWAYADCCITLDRGGDPRQTEMSGVLKRAQDDLNGQEHG